jgi:transcriptional regulator with XRE-family HTH domain
MRQQKGITQEDLAYSSGISLSQIARIETGKINPTLCTLVEIAKNLKVSKQEFFNF